MDDQKALARTYAKLFALGYVPFLLNGWINSYIFDIPVLYWSLELVVWVILPIIVFRHAFRAGLRWEEIGITTTLFGRKLSVLRVLGVLALGFFLLGFTWRPIRWMEQLIPDPGIFNYGQVLPPRGDLRSVIALYFGLSAGIAEELYYRGLLYRISRFHAWPKLLYLAVMPLLFGAAHWEDGIDSLVGAWMVGVVYGLAFLWMRNLLPLMVVHALSDYLTFN